MMHIKNTLPDIKARISSSLQKYSVELAQLGDSMLGNSSNIVLQIITEFSNEYRTILEGNSQELSSIELSGGARISFVFHELYSNGVKAVDPFDNVKDIDIRTILYNSSGPSPALFVGTTAFERIVKQQIKRLEDPSLKCVSLVYDELIRILGQLLTKPLFRRYPSLKEKFHAVVINFFKKVLDPTNKLVKDLVAMEACYINTGHPDFLNGHRVRPTRNILVLAHHSLVSHHHPFSTDIRIYHSNFPVTGNGDRKRAKQCIKADPGRSKDWQTITSICRPATLIESFS